MEQCHEADAPGTLALAGHSIDHADLAILRPPCWAVYLTGNPSTCTPGFQGGTGRFCNHFCPVCRHSVILLDPNHARLLPPELSSLYVNPPSHNFWSRDGKGGYYRVINHTLRCSGSSVIILRDLEEAKRSDVLSFPPLPPSYITAGKLQLLVSQGTLSVNSSGATRALCALTPMAATTQATSEPMGAVASQTPLPHDQQAWLTRLKPLLHLHAELGSQLLLFQSLASTPQLPAVEHYRNALQELSAPLAAASEALVRALTEVRTPVPQLVLAPHSGADVDIATHSQREKDLVAAQELVCREGSASEAPTPLIGSATHDVDRPLPVVPPPTSPGHGQTSGHYDPVSPAAPETRARTACVVA